MVVCTPLSEISNRLMICFNLVLSVKEGKYGCIIQVFEISRNQRGTKTVIGVQCIKKRTEDAAYYDNYIKKFNRSDAIYSATIMVTTQKNYIIEIRDGAITLVNDKS